MPHRHNGDRRPQSTVGLPGEVVERRAIERHRPPGPPHGHEWTFAAQAPAAPADVTITATTQALTAFIFAGSDRDVDITGEAGPVRRCRQLISTMAAVVDSA